MADLTVTAGALAPTKYHDNADSSYSPVVYVQGGAALPAALGQTTKAASLPVTIASDQALPTAIGAANLTTSQPAPTTGATTLAIARATRTRCVILNRGGTQVYVGPATVSAANGFLLDPGASVTLTSVVLIQGISIGATGLCYVSDEYN